ncbi:hypothetical protein ACTFQ6_09135 [Aliivibrio fischeri]|nr:hypothetical protein [Aliivibrio fischeri]
MLFEAGHANSAGVDKQHLAQILRRRLRPTKRKKIRIKLSIK